MIIARLNSPFASRLLVLGHGVTVALASPDQRRETRSHVNAAERAGVWLSGRTKAREVLLIGVFFCPAVTAGWSLESLWFKSTQSDRRGTALAGADHRLTDHCIGGPRSGARSSYAGGVVVPPQPSVSPDAPAGILFSASHGASIEGCCASTEAVTRTNYPDISTVRGYLAGSLTERTDPGALRSGSAACAFHSVPVLAEPPDAGCKMPGSPGGEARESTVDANTNRMVTGTPAAEWILLVSSRQRLAGVLESQAKGGHRNHIGETGSQPGRRRRRVSLNHSPAHHSNDLSRAARDARVKRLGKTAEQSVKHPWPGLQLLTGSGVEGKRSLAVLVTPKALRNHHPLRSVRYRPAHHFPGPMLQDSAPSLSPSLRTFTHNRGARGFFSLRTRGRSDDVCIHRLAWNSAHAQTLSFRNSRPYIAANCLFPWCADAGSQCSFRKSTHPKMKTSLKSTLEDMIQQWAEQSNERNDWPQDGDWNEHVAGQMATAAMAVFQANFTGQKAQKEHAS